MERELSCTFTGHRPSSYGFGYDEEHPDCCKIKELMTMQIVALIENGVKTFLTGMDLGVDIWGAEIILACKKRNPYVRLIAVIPCEIQANRWSVEQRERYFNILARCDDTVYISHHYTSDCLFRRNRWLVDHSNFVIAVYNGMKKGGTAYTVAYAKKQKRAVIRIDPNALSIIPYTVVLKEERG